MLRVLREGKRSRRESTENENIMNGLLANAFVNSNKINGYDNNILATVSPFGAFIPLLLGL